MMNEIKMESKNKTLVAQGPNQKQEFADMHDLEVLLNKIRLPDDLLIKHAPSVIPGNCHPYEIERIESARANLMRRGEGVIKLLSRYRTGNAQWAIALVNVALSKHDEELANIGEILARCSCTQCSDPI